jgi:hypothetical protein
LLLPGALALADAPAASLASTTQGRLPTRSARRSCG